jgi:hypothetical protein
MKKGLLIGLFLAMMLVFGAVTPYVSAQCNDLVLYGIIGNPGGQYYLVTVNSGTGHATEVAPLTGEPVYSVGAIAFDWNTGVLYGLARAVGANKPKSLVTIDICTGEINIRGDITLTTGEPVYLAEGIAINPGGIIYVSLSKNDDLTSETLATVNPGNAEATAVGPITPTAQHEADGLEFVGCMLYATDYCSDDLISYIYTINPSTGTAQQQGATTGFRNVGDMAYNPDSGLLYGFDPGASGGNNPRHLCTISHPGTATAADIGVTHTTSDFGGGMMYGLAWATPSVKCLCGCNITDMAIASDGNTIYVTSDSCSPVYRSTDGGSTFVACTPTAFAAPPQAIAVAPDLPTVVAVADSTPSGSLVWFSSDGGETWNSLGSPCASGTTLTDLALSPPMSGTDPFLGRYIFATIADNAAGTVTNGDVMVIGDTLGWAPVGDVAFDSVLNGVGTVTGTQDYMAIQVSPGFINDRIICVVGTSATVVSYQTIDTSADEAYLPVVVVAGMTTDFSLPANSTSIMYADIALPIDCGNPNILPPFRAYVSIASNTIQSTDDVYQVDYVVAPCRLYVPPGNGVSIRSIDFVGDTSCTSCKLIAGEHVTNKVWYTTNPPPQVCATPTWNLSSEPPTGQTDVVVGINPINIHTCYAGTSGGNSGFFISTDNAATFPPCLPCLPCLPLAIETATGTGTAWFSSCPSNIDPDSLIAVDVEDLPQLCQDNIPQGAIFPHGLFLFQITSITPGSTLTVTICLPSNADENTQYWKCQNGTWSSIPIVDDGNANDNVITIQLTDGGDGDADGTANGTIVDPGGPCFVSPSPAPLTNYFIYIIAGVVVIAAIGVSLYFLKFHPKK